MEILKKAWLFYIKNSFLRNTTALVFELTSITLFCYDVYITFITKLSDYNWYLIITVIILAFIFKKIALRLRITNVCPQCYENRGLSGSATRTGNTENYREYIRGDYWYHSQDVEYLSVTKCCFCSYEVSELYWRSEEWQGDLTEEAKIRKIADETRKAQTKAIIDAHEQIRQRYRGY